MGNKISTTLAPLSGRNHRTLATCEARFDADIVTSFVILFDDGTVAQMLEPQVR